MFKFIVVVFIFGVVLNQFTLAKPPTGPSTKTPPHEYPGRPGTLVLVIVTISTVSGFKPTKAPKPAPQPPHVGRPPRSVCQKQNEEEGCRQEDATCENINREIRNDDKPCKQGCYCVSGYFRNSQGECVTKKECRQKRSVSFAEENFNAGPPGAPGAQE